MFHKIKNILKMMIIGKKIGLYLWQGSLLRSQFVSILNFSFVSTKVAPVSGLLIQGHYETKVKFPDSLPPVFHFQKPRILEKIMLEDNEGKNQAPL